MTRFKNHSAGVLHLKKKSRFTETTRINPLLYKMPSVQSLPYLLYSFNMQLTCSLTESITLIISQPVSSWAPSDSKWPKLLKKTSVRHWNLISAWWPEFTMTISEFIHWRINLWVYITLCLPLSVKTSVWKWSGPKQYCLVFPLVQTK